MKSLPRLRATGVILAVSLLAACGAAGPAAPATGQPPTPAPTSSPAAIATGTPSPTPPTQQAPSAAPPTAVALPSPTASPTPTATAAAVVRVVTSTSILADLVRQVGGERVSVTAMIPVGRDVHTYEPAPSDAQLLADADLVLMNGLGLDDWLEDFVLDTTSGVPLIVVGEDLEGVEYIEPDDDHGHDEEEPEGHAHAANPHLWLDVANARLYAARIADALVAHDPDGQAAYDASAGAYDGRLAELDRSIRQQLEAIPADDRRVISFHDAFPYFARAYGIEIVGVVVDAPGQEPSAGELAQLIDEVRRSGVRAVLTETQFDDRLAQVVADETGVSLIGGLYTDSVGDAPFDTYEAVMRWNVERVVEGLR